MTDLCIVELDSVVELDGHIAFDGHADAESSRYPSSSSSCRDAESSTVSLSTSIVAAADLPVIEDADESSDSNKAGSMSPMYLGPFALQLEA
jgi:hypothetical protein